MTVPLLAEFFAILLNVLEEKGMQEPNVVWVIPIKEVEPFEAMEEGSPTPGKVSSSFKPQPLNSCVVSRPVCHHYL
jgi:hypothetical protein